MTKEEYYKLALSNLWKIKELQSLQNLRGLRQITQLEYEQKADAHPELYNVVMRDMTPEDDIKLILEIAYSIDSDMSVDMISQLFGIWQKDIIMAKKSLVPYVINVDNVDNVLNKVHILNNVHIRKIEPKQNCPINLKKIPMKIDLLTPLSTTPVRNGNTYCSPACGLGCTYKEFTIATEKAKSLKERCEREIGGEWDVRIHENLGWHWSVFHKASRIEIHYGGYLSKGDYFDIGILGGTPSSISLHPKSFNSPKEAWDKQIEVIAKEAKMWNDLLNHSGSGKTV
jgi:hypothetical protein